MRIENSGGVPSIGTLSRVWVVLLLLLAVPAVAQEESKSPSPSRPGSTINGSSPVDPSENVKALSEAANKRQDDLRIASKELFEAKITAETALSELRSKFDREYLKATVDKLESDAKLRAEYGASIAATEKARVDAIRLVDTGAVAIANERAVATANTLAKTVTDTATALGTQVSRNADDLRLLVKTTADEQTRNLQQQFAAVQSQITSVSSRITALEQTGAEGVGRQKFQDPAIAQMLIKLDALANREVNRTGVDTGRSDVAGWVIGVASSLILILVAIGGLFIRLNQQRSP